MGASSSAGSGPNTAGSRSGASSNVDAQPSPDWKAVSGNPPVASWRTPFASARGSRSWRFAIAWAANASASIDQRASSGSVMNRSAGPTSMPNVEVSPPGQSRSMDGSA